MTKKKPDRDSLFVLLITAAFAVLWMSLVMDVTAHPALRLYFLFCSVTMGWSCTSRAWAMRTGFPLRTNLHAFLWQHHRNGRVVISPRLYESAKASGWHTPMFGFQCRHGSDDSDDNGLHVVQIFGKLFMVYAVERTAFNKIAYVPFHTVKFDYRKPPHEGPRPT